MAVSPSLPAKDFVWQVEKYARFVPLENVPRRLPVGQGQSGTWKHFGEKELRGGDLRLSIFQGGHLLLGVQREVFENFLLWNAHKWLRVATKGDSMLFVCENAGQASRRFRIKFRDADGKSGDEHCAHCVSLLSHYTEVRDLSTPGVNLAMEKNAQRPAQGSGQASVGQTRTGGDEHPTDAAEAATPCLTSTATMSDLAKKYVGRDDALPLGLAYQATAFPTSQLPVLIQLCLIDGNFPAFVEAVDKELRNLMAS